MPLSKPLIGVMLLCVTGWVSAASPPPASMARASKDDVRSAGKAIYVDGFGKALTASGLAIYSGEGLVLSNQSISGQVTGDTATNVATGSNVVMGGSLAGASGLPSVIQNTGNNVLIQTGVIVNVQMKP